MLVIKSVQCLSIKSICLVSLNIHWIKSEYTSPWQSDKKPPLSWALILLRLTNSMLYTKAGLILCLYGHCQTYQPLFSACSVTISWNFGGISSPSEQEQMWEYQQFCLNMLWCTIHSYRRGKPEEGKQRPTLCFWTHSWRELLGEHG